MNLDGYLNFVRENTLSEREVSADIIAGRCKRVPSANGRGGVEYTDGRRLDLIDGIYYTPEAFVTLFLVSHAMSSNSK